MEFSAVLPVPPTANNLFPTSRSGHRFPSKKYKAWKEAAEKPFNETMRGKVNIPGRLHVRYEYAFADARRRDIANFEKAVTDFLVTKGVFIDDCQIDIMQLVRRPQAGTAEVFITVQTIEGIQVE